MKKELKKIVIFVKNFVKDGTFGLYPVRNALLALLDIKYLTG